jgi:aspartate kinase
MIVLKFGGSSLASSSAIRQAAAIVSGQIERRPVVVVSAVGKTTDQLLAILHEARKEHEDETIRLQRELQDAHWRIASELVDQTGGDWALSKMQTIFRDLHVRMLEVARGERSVDPELTAEVIAVGEQLSSLLVAAAFQSLGIETVHADSRDLVRTDDAVLAAKPLFWETYARIRWASASWSRYSAVVLGGFIGSAADGRTTTLGRGGSDLTASLVGAALNVEEIQIWKDVDGMLTCDPRLEKSDWCVRRLTYPEAEHLAQSGAKLLHPDTVAPARRLRIPIYLKNTFCPQIAGTEISGERTRGPVGIVKSIACLKHVHVLRIRPSDSAVSRASIGEQVRGTLERQRVEVQALGETEQDLVLALNGDADFSHLVFGFDQCLQVHLQSQQSVITLVGDGIARSRPVLERVERVLRSHRSAFLLSLHGQTGLLRITVPERDGGLLLSRLHAALFSQADPALFHPVWTSDPVKALENVAGGVAESDRATVRAGHRILTLAQRT